MLKHTITTCLHRREPVKKIPPNDQYLAQDLHYFILTLCKLISQNYHINIPFKERFTLSKWVEGAFYIAM